MTSKSMRLVLMLSLAATGFLSGCETTRIAKTEVVAGIVQDAKTKKPIVGAKVMFLDRKDTITKTDARGEFICGPGYMQVPIELGFPLTFAPETRIQISAAGYQTKVMQAYPRVEWTQKSQTSKPKVLVINLQKK